MKIKCFNVNEWLYPDSEIDVERKSVSIATARGGDNCFSVLTDLVADEGTPVSYSAHFDARGVSVRLFELAAVNVPHNSGERIHVTDDYEIAKEYVTRKAPFDVFDITYPITDAGLHGGRVAFFVRVDAFENADAGKHHGEIKICVGERSATVDVELCIHKTVLSRPKDSPYSMVNWISPANVARMHGVTRGSEEFYDVFKEYFKEQIDMRNTHFQLPTLIPVTDSDGRVIDFDTKENERLGSLALECGYKCIYGGFVAHWNDSKAAPMYLVWDRSICSEDYEGIRQLNIYFKRIDEMIKRCGWQNVYMQGLVDEPQIANSVTYRALCGFFRKAVPDIKIIDPVETPDIHASCDIHVIKQACYDKDIEGYEKLRETSDELWVYTCGYPAGRWMNHVLDLPLSATRLPIWQGVRYGMTGFLHWGYNGYNEKMDTMKDTCFPRLHHGEPTTHPAGNHAIIYGDTSGFYESVRAHVQRISAGEGELLLRLCKKDSDVCKNLISKVTKSFYDYTYDMDAVESAHNELLALCDEMEV